MSKNIKKDKKIEKLYRKIGEIEKSLEDNNKYTEYLAKKLYNNIVLLEKFINENNQIGNEK